MVRVLLALSGKKKEKETSKEATIMDAMFRKSLSDLVRGIRSHKKDENEYINKALQEIKEELRLVNKKAKMVAVQKLTYVRFHIIK